jgi:anti-sigma28 factor (negative regulator of flagellin synthesis)
MQAIRKPFPLATQPRAAFESSGLERQSPEQSPTATSGTYFKAVRPTEGEAAAVARGEPVMDCAKVEGLRFELDVGIWHGDSDRIARCLIDDADYLDDGDGDDE